MAGATVQFTDTSTPSGEIAGWIWLFGDGGVSFVQNPQHAYVADGFFTVTLQVVGTFGGSSIFTVQLAINVVPALVNEYA